MTSENYNFNVHSHVDILVPVVIKKTLAVAVASDIKHILVSLIVQKYWTWNWLKYDYKLLRAIHIFFFI